MKYLVGVVALIVSSSSAFGQSAEIRRVASNLGNVIASEEVCGLTFNQEAIAAFIESNVPADEMSFVPRLTTVIQGSKHTLSSMSTSAKTAHCTQVKRSAKAFGFIS